MRTQRSLLFSLLFLVFATFSAAWPWPRWLPELDSLVVRQDNNNNNNQESSAQQTASPTATPTNTNTNTNTKESSARPSDSSSTDAPNSSSTKQQSGSITGSGTSTGTQKTSSNKSTSTKARTTSYDQRMPAGGIAMITPSVQDGSQLYKIGDFITFAWNYTSLQATPTAINVVATCQKNNQLYTIAMNQTVTNATQAVTWDTGGYQKTAAADPLIVDTYTLIIYDAASAVTANSQPGYLAVFKQPFSMYTPRPYVPLAEFVCVTCSGALGDMEKRALGLMLGMSFLTVMSFTWFVGGTGVIW